MGEIGLCHLSWSGCGNSSACPSQADLESILQLPVGRPPHFTEATALRAFNLHCRLSIHIQHKVMGCGLAGLGQGRPELWTPN